MRRRVLAGVIGSLLLAFDPGIAAPPASLLGTVNSRGAVEVNGVRAPNGMNVYAGNRIITGRVAVAIVMLAGGGKLVLGGSTSASLTSMSEGLLVKLDRGVVDAVSEEKVPVLVEVEGVTIRARNRDGVFEVAANGRSLRVVARRGAVLAEAANQSARVDAGKTMKTTVAPATEGSRGEMKTILIVAGAAGAAGLAATVSSLSGSSKQTCVSPSQLSCP
jgi:ferric-dicitrate binding protein FerR (iron transport regulator)